MNWVDQGSRGGSAEFAEKPTVILEVDTQENWNGEELTAAVQDIPRRGYRHGASVDSGIYAPHPFVPRQPRGYIDHNQFDEDLLVARIGSRNSSTDRGLEFEKLGSFKLNADDSQNA